MTDPLHPHLPPATAGWYLDPTWRHQRRRYDGTAWTDDVRDDEVDSIDPLGPLPPGRDAWVRPEIMELLGRPRQPARPDLGARFRRVRPRSWVLVGAVALVAFAAASMLWGPGAVAWTVVLVTFIGGRIWWAIEGGFDRD